MNAKYKEECKNERSETQRNFCTFGNIGMRLKCKNFAALIFALLTYKVMNSLQINTFRLFMIFWICAITSECAGHDKIRLQLRWDHQFQFAGYYAAEWKGYYTEQDLNVEIRSALADNGNILFATQEVSEGRADFGIGAADILIANDKGADLCIVATIFQQSAARFYLKQETPFSSLADLTKLRVARRVNDLIDVEFQSMLLSEGIDPEKIKPYPHQPGINHLLTDQVHIIPGYSTTIPFYTAKNGIRIKVIHPVTYGINFYGDSIFTRYSLIQKHPELVKRFVKESLKGWEYALEHPDEMVEAISARLKRKFPIQNLSEFNHFQAKEVRKLTLYPIVELGHINPFRWGKMYGLLKTTGVVKGKFEINKIIFNYEKFQLEREKKIREQSFFSLWILTSLLFVTFIIILLLRKIIKTKTARLRKTNQELTKEIQERKEIEITLKESEDRYRLLFDMADDMIFVHGLVTDEFSDKFIEVNDTMCHTLEYSKEEILQLSQSDIIIVEGLDKTFDRKNELIEKKHLWIETKFITKSGEKISVEIRANLFDFQGKPTVLSIARDISERKRTENALKESEERFRLAFENASIGMCLMDTKGNFLRVNHQMCEIFGYAKAELEKMSVKDITHPDYLNASPKFIQRALTGEVDFAEFEKQYFHKKGHIIWGKVSSSLVRNGHGEPLYFISHVQDITESKNAAEAIVKERHRLFSVLDTLPAFVYLQARDYTIAFANRKFHELFGAPENRPCYEVICLGKSPCEVCPTFRVFHTKSPETWEWTSASGRTYVMYDDFFSDIDGQDMVLEIGIDITQRKKAEERLKATLKEKVVLVKEIHHRVKNNLQSLIYLMDMQLESVKSSEVTKVISELQGRARAMALVHEKLSYSDNLAQIDIGKYIKDLAFALFDVMRNNRQIILHVDAADIKISIDLAIPCGLIINELVTNALKYAFPDDHPSCLSFAGNRQNVGCEIRIRFELQGGEYILTISDNGVGLPLELDWRTTESLGLKLVNIWAVYQLGGRIKTDTQNGTTFIIRFSKRKSAKKK